MKAHERLDKEYEYGRRASDIRLENDLRIRRHWLHELPLILLCLLVSAVGVYASYKYPWSVQHLSLLETESLAMRVPIPFFALLPLLFLTVLLHRLFDTQLIISLDHVRLVSGICSLQSSDTRIDYENVRGIEIDRNLYQRVLKLGTLKVGSSMHSGVEVEMIGVYNPARYRQLIENRIRLHFEKLSRNMVVERVRKTAF